MRGAKPTPQPPTPTPYRYVPVYRPASYGALPAGVAWLFVEAPHDLAHIRTDLPRSAHRYGVIETERELTAQEIATHELRCVIF